MSEEPRIGLAIAGGGFRATLYSLGALKRLNQFGMLQDFNTITSVSGGSILTAYLAIKWRELHFDHLGVATNFDKIISQQIEQFCARTIDTKSVLKGLFSFSQTVGDKVAQSYDDLLFQGANIQDIPSDAPEFIFYGTNYQTGSSIRIQKSGISDYKIGHYPSPDLPIAKVVGISSAFPPILSPVTLATDPTRWMKTDFASINDYNELKSRLQLCDGGLYDNLGLEAISKGKGRYTHVLSCDAGAPLTIQPRIKTNYASQLLRMTDIMTDQQRALRKRKLIRDFMTKGEDGRQLIYGGTYFGIATEINNYKFEDAMTYDTDVSLSLKNMRTRLNHFSEKEQGHLINWGYALTDTAIRKWCPTLTLPQLLVKGTWPKPKYTL